MIQCSRCCVSSIRPLPRAPRDPSPPDQVQVDGEICHLLAPEVKAVMNCIRCERFISQASSGLIAAAKPQQVDGVGGRVFSQHRLVEAPAVLVRRHTLACWAEASWRVNSRCSRFFTSTYTGGTTPSDNTVTTTRPPKITVPSDCWL